MGSRQKRGGKTTLQLENFFFRTGNKRSKEIVVTKGIFSPKIIGIVKGHHAQSQRSEIVEKGLLVEDKNDRL